MGWKVIDQQQTVARQGGSGRTIDVVRVTYQTDTGFEGYVDVPVTVYNASDGTTQVRALIDEAVAKHDEVRTLTSEQPQPAN